MIVRLLLAALAAGLVAGLAMTPAQYVKVVPLILEAETYEVAEAPGHSHGAETAVPAEDATAHSHEHEDGDGSMFGMGRLGDTLVANLVAGAGFALLLGGVALVLGIGFPKGREAVTRGLMLGAAGWFAVQLAPSFGLPPELPGFPFVDLATRQIWWLSAVVLSAAGLYLLVLRPEWVAKVAGVALIVAPHVYGAPQPEDISSAVPALLASEFTSAALATTLFFWLVLGGVMGYLFSRVEGDAV